MSGWRAVVATAGFVLAAVACAKLAGLESPDTPASDDDAGSFAVNAVGAKISPTRMTIETSCKVAEESHYITIENESDDDIHFEVTSPTPSVVGLKASATAAASDKVSGTVRAHDIKLVYTSVASAVAGKAQAELFVKTGTLVQRIPVDITVDGAALVFVPPLIDFGQVRRGTRPPPQPLEIDNTGNTPITIASWSGDDTDFAIGNGSLTIRPGENVSTTVGFMEGDAGAPVTVTRTPATDPATCGDPPALTLKGERVNVDVTVGPGAVDFGNQPCNSTPNVAKTIEIKNYSGDTAKFEVVLPAGEASLFTVDPTSGSIPKATGGNPQTAQVTVRLKPLTARPGPAATESIQVNITAPDPAKATRVVTASVQVIGAWLDIAPTTLGGFTPNGTKTFKVTNNGNALTFVTETSSDSAFSVDNGSDPAPIDPPGGIFGNSITMTVRMVAQGGSHASDVTTKWSPPPPLVFLGSAPVCNVPAVVKASTD